MYEKCTKYPKRHICCNFCFHPFGRVYKNIKSCISISYIIYTYVIVSLILTKCSHATFTLSVRKDIDASIHVLNSSRVIDE